MSAGKAAIMSVRTTTNSDRAWAPDQHAFAPAAVIPDALILQTSTVAGKIEGDAPALRVAFVDDAAATFTAEGAAIDEADPTLDEVLVYTGKITQLVKISREQWNQEGTAGQLSESVRRAVVRKANEAYLAQPAPTSPAVTPPAGIVGRGITIEASITNNLDPLIDLLSSLEGQNGTPSHIVMDPAGWAALRKIKTATGHATALLGAGTTDSERMLLDLPVIVNPAMPAGSGLVIDRTAIASAIGQVLVGSSEHAYFTSDSIALLATWRISWNLVHPDRIGNFKVTLPTQG